MPSVTREPAVGCLDDLGGFPNCPVPDSGVGDGSFGGVEPGREAESGYSCSARPLRSRQVGDQLTKA
jgi:hypothetical protein